MRTPTPAAVALAVALGAITAMPGATQAAPQRHHGDDLPVYAKTSYAGKAHLRHYEALAKVKPGFLNLFEAGVACAVNGRPREAIAYYKAALRIDPWSGEVWTALGNAYERGLHDTARAIAAYRRATVVDPGYGPAWADIGHLYEAKGETAAAAAAFLRGTKAAPNYDGDWLALVFLYVTKHDAALAKRYAQAALRALPTTDSNRPFLEEVVRSKKW